jgi:Rrf2 family cysteine metabolism transcriptional repressor
MKISFKGDYAIKALLYLGIKYEDKPEKYYQIGEISQNQDIPEKFLEQIFLILKRAGYLKSHRGANGGFALNKTPQEIVLGDIIRLIEGPIACIACVSKSAYQYCDFEERCVLRPIWKQIRDTVNQIVDNITFQDLIKKEKQRIKQQSAALMYYI